MKLFAHIVHELIQLSSTFGQTRQEPNHPVELQLINRIVGQSLQVDPEHESIQNGDE